MASADLHIKYRPGKWKSVLGQEAVVSSVRKVLEQGSCHAFLFTGPSGVGKTTLARLIAKSVGCEKANLVEVDAATYTGIDAMRNVTDGLQYSAMGESPVKVLIIDEAHALSKAAWQSLLKSVEEPPSHVYWVLCTTEPSKIPETIRTRCSCYELKPVGKELLFGLLKVVVEAEGMKASQQVLYLVAEKAGGSVRRALTYLSQCVGCTDRRAAAEVLRTVADEEDGEVIDLCRALVKGCGWSQAVGLVQQFKDTNPEGVRQVVVSYFTAVTLGAKDASRAQKALAVLEAFGEPYPPSNTIYPVLLSLGQLLL